MSTLRPTLVLAMGLFVGGATAWAQTPFADSPVSAGAKAKTAVTAPDAAESPKTGFWKRISNSVKKAYTRLTTGVNKAATRSGPPAFVTTAATIPGHDGREFVCQGIAHLPSSVILPASDQPKTTGYRYAVLSYYPEPEHTDHPSQLVVVETRTGKALRRFGLFEREGRPYTGHAGGVAVAGKYVWVASGFKIYGFSLQAILEFLNDETATGADTSKGVPASLKIPARDLSAEKVFDVDSKAGYLSFDGTCLWVGDFVKSSNDDFAPVPHHAQNPFKRNAWIAGYRVDADGAPVASEKYQYTHDGKTRTAYKPDRVLLVRESVQGMAVCGERIALSLSYGAMNSKLAWYSSPLKTSATRLSYTPAGQKKTFTVDAWELADGKNWLKTVGLPAGSEDLEFDGRRLYVTFEGGSQNYRQKWISINPLITISEKYYLIDPDQSLK